jgi:hypothetical protein
MGASPNGKENMSFKPTAEQDAINAAFDDGFSIVVQARAGTGKTTTCVGIGERAEKAGKKGIYIVYNAKAKQDAEKKFGKNVTVKTGHGLAWNPMRLRMGLSFSEMQALTNGPRVTRKDVCNILNITHGFGDEDTYLAPGKLAGFVMETVKNFCYSDSNIILDRHVPKVPGTEDYKDEFVLFCVTKAREAWASISTGKTRLQFTHDYYLKMFALDDPKLTGDFIILDEAQDANPVMAQIVNNQTHMQRIMVGDSCQSIYGWRGAVDALSNFKADKTLYLSKSFRFGPAVADEANKWLTLLGETVMLEGHDPVNSVVEPFDSMPDGTAVLCRTNAEVMAQAMAGQEAGRKVAIVGGAAALMAYAEAAIDLMNGKGTWHHELQAFKSWTAVQNYCKDEPEEAGSLAVMVKMIDTYGPEAIIAMAQRCTDEANADLILSTAHKAKGAEWDYVLIGEDFKPQTDKEGRIQLPSREAMMLAYVSVTRAKVQLDNLGLSWVDQFLGSEA